MVLPSFGSHQHVRNPISCAVSLIQRVRYSYDRVKFSIDSINPKLDLPSLEEDCAKITMVPGAGSQTTRSVSTIDVLQPNAQFFKKLNGMSRGIYVITPIYIELSLDFLTANTAAARALSWFISKSFCPKSVRKSLNLVRKIRDDGEVRFTTAYVGTRKCANRFAFYWDRPAKSVLFRRFGCMHLERRMVGADLLRTQGLASIHDLITFDHENHWNNNLRLYAQPTNRELDLAVSGDPTLSRQAYANRVKAFMETQVGAYETSKTKVVKGKKIRTVKRLKYHGGIVLHNLKQILPNLTKVLRRIDNRGFLRGQQ